MKMGRYIKQNRVLLTCLIAGLSLVSCSVESPFSDERQGHVRLDISVNSKITRADISGDEYKSLLDKCVISINNSTGLIHRWEGFSNVPTDGIYLKYGSYHASAISGDSIPASFEATYYKGSTDFEVSKNTTTQVSISCKIANVVTSVDASTIDNEIIKDVNVEIKSTSGSLEFIGDKLSSKGYFMIPKGENSLTYSVSGKDALGKEISKTGVILDVKPAHEYKIKFSYDGSEKPSEGGVAFDIIIEEYSLLQEDDVIIYGKPVFYWKDGHDVDEQLVGIDGDFISYTLCIGAYEGFSSLSLESKSPEIQATIGNAKYDVLTDKDNLEDKGISFSHDEVRQGIGKYYITLSNAWLNGLQKSDKEYVITVEATDATPDKKTASYEVRIANSETALDVIPPVSFDVNFVSKDYTAVGARSATIPVEYNSESEFSDVMILYKNNDELSWNSQSLVTTKADTDFVRLSNLTPGKEYQYKFVAGEETDGVYEYESKINTFKTEEEFVIPNSSLENWCNVNKIVTPKAENEDKFWDTGNEGAAMANATLTDKTSDIKHNGTYAAKLSSKYVILKFGAGNLFTGEFAGTSGTNGIINFGREYNGSHPSKLRLWVKYEPKVAEKNKGADDKYVPAGTLDKGQIYIALSTEKKTVDTGDSKTLVTEDNLPSTFVAYGQYTFEGNYDDNGQMKMLEIPFEYFDNAKNNKPKYLIIVCSASKYGDYFSGGDGSTMYVDDFELVYE